MVGDTRPILMESALGLVRRRGYSAFSYADLAEVVGIRKASIHHHFPSKEDLGEALVAVYIENFAEALRQIDQKTTDPIERLRLFAALYREGLARKEGCLCGVLASEIAVLPPRVQAGVRRFFAANLEWLEQTLTAGAGDLRPGIDPHRDARTILSALQGAMFLALSTEDPAAFDSAADGVIAGLRPA
jgi:TetR/AcrR family transcriptional regulator, transcriptional repressor for nem operon